MKVIYKVVIPIFLAIFLTACHRFSQDAISTLAVETALVNVRTALAETQAAIPTDTPTPSPLPTFAIPTVTITPLVSNPDGLVHPVPEDRLDYAMAIAPTVYTRLPYVSDAPLYGEYSGCAETNDFRNFVTYVIPLPIELITTAFEKYFQSEKWEFTEATTEMIGDDKNIAQISYDVYRISSKNIPAFERLTVLLRDESQVRGQDHIDVRVVLTHIETKKYFKDLADFYCGPNNGWLWIRLQK